MMSSDDGTRRVWDARYSQSRPRVYIPKPKDALNATNNFTPASSPLSTALPMGPQILCCAYNANGTVFVTGSSDAFARVYKSNTDGPDQVSHEIDILAGHENVVNYVQFSGCAVASRSSPSDFVVEDSIPKFKNSWFNHDHIVTCSHDGSVIIWVPGSRRSHGKVGRWVRAYHLKVPPPPMPPNLLEETYVSDVHPFYPRIAMSVGYDGKIIMWDETQLTPYVRNIQDPICDSSMLLYPEPYQSTYQQCRLGALGIEWRPSSIAFAIGTDIGMGQEFQILPLADLDFVPDPLPDYGDAMYWEPENDVMNDDTDSEYNVTEEYFSDEKISPSGSTSNDSVCSEEDKVRQNSKDRTRRSK